jgi:hypothetical protein
MQSLMLLKAWALAHPEEAAALAYAILNMIVALVPMRYHEHPLFGLALRVLARVAALTPPDAKGTLKLPGGGVVQILPPKAGES